MNAVVALCSFCELHGPSVLFCTQTFHEDTEASEFTNSIKEGASSANRKDWYGPDYFTKRASSLGSDTIFPPLKSTNCDGCTSMTDEKRGFIDNDHEARVSYVSSQYPLHPDVFSVVRQACVRSLSCEVCPGREGPIFFGDDDRGHVLSHTFFMKDTQARGLQSWYSIIIVMMDKIFLLNSWQFFVQNLQNIIQELQEKALEVFNAEQSEHNQRAVRLNSVTGMTLDTFRRQRGNVKARSIVELTNDKNLFLYLHRWFSWLLKAGAERMCERLVESYPCEDAIVDLERQEETEEGFIKVHIKKSESECLPVISSKVPEEAERIQDIEIQETGIRFSSIRELYQVLGQESFLCLAYHTIVGNQIIMKSTYLPLMKSIISCLKELIPHGCFHPIYYSVIYEDSWKCNFLGLLPDTSIPDHVHSSELHIQINITKKSNTEELSSISDFDFVFHTTAQVPEKIPQVLSEMNRVIVDDSFSLPAMYSFFHTEKERWMNKVKLLFAFSRGKQRTPEETSKLFTVLGAQEHDKMLLKFWMTGLSSQYKTYILSSVVQGKPDMQKAPD